VSVAIGEASVCQGLGAAPTQRREPSNDPGQSTSSPHDGGHDGPQSVAATQRSYVHAVAKFSRFFGRSPEHLDLEDVRTFQVRLVAGGMSWPALTRPSAHFASSTA
jgi:hypothetical protein